jgi:hypothetical protein
VGADAIEKMRVGTLTVVFFQYLDNSFLQSRESRFLHFTAEETVTIVAEVSVLVSEFE